MPKISFDDAFLVGIEQIDKQHEKLIGLINHLHDAILTQKATRGLTTKILIELFEYTSIHFTYEEKLMEKREYPQFEIHRTQHRVFANKVHNYLDAQQKGEILLNTTLMSDLMQWLSGHILKTDKLFGEYLTSEENRC